jgi:formylglycine-generating enzyme required for sulfatase activity
MPSHIHRIMTLIFFIGVICAEFPNALYFERVLVSLVLPAQDAPKLKSTNDMAFVKIRAGKFLMGSVSGEENEEPAHRVVISRDFEIGKHEVTQAQWEAVMGDNPSRFIGNGSAFTSGGRSFSLLGQAVVNYSFPTNASINLRSPRQSGHPASPVRPTRRCRL